MPANPFTGCRTAQHPDHRNAGPDISNTRSGGERRLQRREALAVDAGEEGDRLLLAHPVRREAARPLDLGAAGSAGHLVHAQGREVAPYREGRFEDRVRVVALAVVEGGHALDDRPAVRVAQPSGAAPFLRGALGDVREPVGQVVEAADEAPDGVGVRRDEAAHGGGSHGSAPDSWGWRVWGRGTRSGAGQRGLGAQQPALAQLRPEGGGHTLVERPEVLGDARGTRRSRDRRDRGGVGQRELERRRLDGNAVPLGQLADAPDAFDDLARSLLVLEVGAAREDTGAVRTADDQVDTLLGGGGQHALEGAGVVEERVAPGEEEAVGTRLVQVQGQLDGLHPVDAEPPRLDHALLAQLRQDAEGTRAGGLELGEPAVAVEVLRDVVDPHDVEPVGAEPLEAVLDRTVRGVRRVVVDDLVRAAVLEEAALLAEVARGRVLDLVEDDAADLRREHVRVPGVLREHLAEPDLGEPRAVEGGAVVVPDALVPGGPQSGAGLLLGDRAEHVAERGRPETEPAGKQSAQTHDASAFPVGVAVLDRCAARANVLHRCPLRAFAAYLCRQ
ncbi:putative dehydrogenase [Streptomyces sp. Tu6071]|nr:putative dehydrogenase [Streptomyces sp. Tu6071]